MTIIRGTTIPPLYINVKHQKRVKMEKINNHQQQNRSEGLTSTFPKNGKKMFKIFRRCKVLLVNTSEHHFTMPKSPRLCKCCAKTVSKKIKCLKIRHLTLAFVGITGLEPATSRPPDVCATNCAKSRLAVQNYILYGYSANFSGFFLFPRLFFMVFGDG